MKRQVRIGAALSYFAIALNICAGLLYTPWMIEQIGQSQYGLYTLVNSLISMFMVDFGLSSATARYVSEYRVNNEEEKINAFLGAIYKLYIIIDTVIMIVLIVVFLSLDTLYKSFTASEMQQFKVVYCIAAGYSLISFPFITLNGILTAYERFIELKIADIIYRILTIVLIVIALLNGLGLYSLVTINAVIGLAVVVYKFAIVKLRTPIVVRFRRGEKGVIRELFSFSVWTTIASLAQRLVFNITPTILGMVSNAAAIAIFGIVTTIESYSFTITNAINGMFMPRISRIYANQETDETIMPLMLRVGRFQFVLNGLIVVGFIVLGKQFISLWVGDAYIDAYWGLLLVLVPGLFYNPLQIAHTAMVVKNKVDIQAKVNIAMGAINVCLSFVLSRYFGVVGACASIFFAYVFRAMALIALYDKHLGVNIRYFVRNCYFRNIPSILFSIIIAGVYIQNVQVMDWKEFLVHTIVVLCIYLTNQVLFALTSQERRILIGNIRHKIIRIFKAS